MSELDCLNQQIEKHIDNNEANAAFTEVSLTGMWISASILLEITRSSIILTELTNAQLNTNNRAAL